MNEGNEQRKILNQMAKIQMKREYIYNHTEALVRQLIHDKGIRRMIMTKDPEAITQLDCHHDIVSAYNRICFRFGSVNQFKVIS
jgi:hypothetical protein